MICYNKYFSLLNMINKMTSNILQNFLQINN